VKPHPRAATADQIALIRESLDYAARAIREYDYSPLAHEEASKLRREKEALIASVRASLGNR